MNTDTNKTTEERAREYARTIELSSDNITVHEIMKIANDAFIAGASELEKYRQALEDATRWRNVNEELPLFTIVGEKVLVRRTLKYGVITDIITLKSEATIRLIKSDYQFWRPIDTNKTR